MKLTDYLTEENIKIGINATGKKEIISELLSVAVFANPNLNEKEAMQGLLKREDIGSTGIGNGVAIPHAGIKSCTKITPVLGLTKEGRDFESLDGKPVKTFFLILYPENQIKIQLKFLARVSRLLRDKDLKSFIEECSSPDEVIKVLNNYETKHFS